ncbi:hypothetical protein ACFSKL_16145 [Belliella marina]|uniref:DUF4304 domain-containing protein n=1 Tax=Belliella marina TaxID=1644146 RepID=A0ABW4VQC4_9BACT
MIEAKVMTLKQFEKELDEKLIKGFQSLDFFQVGKHHYSREFENGKVGSILVEKTDRRTKETWFINIQILFIHDKVEQLGQEVAKEFYAPNYIVNTVFENLGYLTPQNEYITFDFTIGQKESRIQKTIDDLLETVEKHAVPMLKKLCDDEELFKKMRNNGLGLQITNQIKAPILLFLMGNQNEAYELATSTLAEIRPTPKNPQVQEPENFINSEEAFSFFRRDKDPLYYYNYKIFHNRFRLKINF